MSKNVKEMKKTGGGTASVSTENSFNFNPAQIQGLDNLFDNDCETMQKIYAVDEVENEEIIDVALSSPKVVFKKVKFDFLLIHLFLISCNFFVYSRWN